jgi:hypothetical protein
MTAEIYHTQNPMDRDDARSANRHAPAAWCVIGPKNEILVLSKASIVRTYLLKARRTQSSRSTASALHRALSALPRGQSAAR